MKKRILIWLSLLVLFTGSAAALWWAQDFSTSDPAPQANESNINASSRAVQKSPVLGKEIPGLPEYCADKLISVSGCDGMTEITSEQGNTYRLVEIGDQCWFADNLKEIPTTEEGWYGFYDDAVEEPAPGEGMLYTWDAVMNGEINERAQGVCPSGWHIPTVCDFALSLSSLWSNFDNAEKPGLARSSIDFQTGEIYRKFGSMDEMLSFWSSSKAGRGAMSAIYDGSTINIIGDLRLSPASNTNAISTRCVLSN